MAKFVTSCPRNCYSTCSMIVEITDGRLTGIAPHPANKATPEGLCLKGLSYFERLYSPERIICPLKRDRQSGEFTRCTWDEALDLITEKLKYYKDTFGPQSVLFYNGSGTKGLLNGVSTAFWKLFGGYTATYGDLCWPSGLEATRLSFGDIRQNAVWDLENAELIVMWGKNAAETNVHQTVFIDRALEKGAQLVVVDPRRTQTSERANLLLQIRPGTDGALALGVARILIEKDMIDREFIRNSVLGFEEFAASVQKYTLEYVSSVTDIPQNYIEKFANLVGSDRRMTICAGFGMQRYTNSGQTMRALISLLALTGNISRNGSGWKYANLQSHIFDTVKDPVASFPPDRQDGNIRVSISTAKLGEDMLAADDPPLKMIWVERGNPLSQNPDIPATVKAFRALDFRVVVDQFITDTAREADLILPAKSIFEQTDVINAYWHDYIQIKQKVTDPPGEVKPETEIYYLLADRLGFDRNLAGELIPAPSDEAVERYLEKRLRPFPEITLEKLKQGPVLSPGHTEIAWEDCKFTTPSGKIELYSEEAKRRWGLNPLPDFTEPVESARSAEGETYPLYLMTPNTKNGIHSQFLNLAMIRRNFPEPFAAMNPADMAARNLNSGDRAAILNGRGSITLKIVSDLSLKKGCVVVVNGWQNSDGGAVNLLSKGRETDMGYGAAFHDNMVEVEKR